MSSPPNPPNVLNYEPYMPPTGGIRNSPVTRWLLILNVGIFFLDLLSRGHLTEWGAFSLDQAIYHGQVWRFISFQFLHAGIMHILVNMFVLFFFGPIVEAVMSKSRFLIFYLICGCAGACSLILFGKLHLLESDAQTQMVGASAGLFGILVAAAKIAPNTRVTLLLAFLIPVRMRLVVLVWLCIGLAVATILM